MTKVPFIYTECRESIGFDINLVEKKVNGNSSGVDITGISKIVEGDSRGLDVTAVYKSVEGSSEGMDIGLVKIVEGDAIGFDISGVTKIVKGCSKGVSLTGVYNYSWGVEDFLIQYGTLGNYIEKKDDKSFGLQVGLYNRIGDQTCPLINVWGLKNIPKYLKNKKKAYDIKVTERALEMLKREKSKEDANGFLTGKEYGNGFVGEKK